MKRQRSPHSENNTEFEQVALLLQGGGALGAYQGGVYEALDEAGIIPNWIGGISIGAINGAIIAGNKPGVRVKKLRAFWEFLTADPLWNTFSASNPLIEQGGDSGTSLLEPEQRGLVDERRRAGVFSPAYFSTLYAAAGQPFRHQFLRHGRAGKNTPEVHRF